MKLAEESEASVVGALRVAWSVAQVALIAGGAAAVYQIFSRKHVLEFQAGQGSSLGERLQAIAQQTALESLGFGLVALGCALGGLVLGRLLPLAAGAGARFAAATLACAGAFVMWTLLAPLAEDALPFLARNETLLLNAAALLFCLASVLIYFGVTLRMPGASGVARVPLAFTCAVFACLGVYYGLDVFRGVAGAWSPAPRIAAACAPLVVGLFLAAPIARIVGRFLGPLGQRFATGWPLPRPLAVVVVICLVASIAVTATNLKLSAVQPTVAYRSLLAPGSPQGPNVVFVTVDTLRADHLGSYGYERPTSPFLDSLAAAGVRCADPVASAAWTKPATGTILSGLYPSRHGALYHGSMLRLPEGERTLAEAFRDAGFVTAGFVTNPNIKRVFGFDRGFEEFFDSPVEDTLTLAALRGALIGRIATDLLRHQFNWKYENDVRTMNKHVFGWLEKNHEQPFFLYIHYIDPHSPYAPPEPYLSEFKSEPDGLLFFNERKEHAGRDLYDGEIRYVDEGLRELVDELKRLNTWENTLFVLTSDHGEEFFEHGVLGHGYSLYQPVVGVPVLLHGPGVSPGHVIEEPVQVVDLPATVLDLAQTGVTELGDGRSFAARVRGEPQGPDNVLFLENEFGMGHNMNREFVFKGVRKGRWKLVITEANAFFPTDDPASPPFALYDLEADPAELENRFHEESSRPIVTELMALLDEHLLFLQETGFRDAAPAAISDEIQRNLDALGY